MKTKSLLGALVVGLSVTLVACESRRHERPTEGVPGAEESIKLRKSNTEKAESLAHRVELQLVGVEQFYAKITEAASKGRTDGKTPLRILIDSLKEQKGFADVGPDGYIERNSMSRITMRGVPAECVEVFNKLRVKEGEEKVVDDKKKEQTSIKYIEHLEFLLLTCRTEGKYEKILDVKETKTGLKTHVKMGPIVRLYNIGINAAILANPECQTVTDKEDHLLEANCTDLTFRLTGESIGVIRDLSYVAGSEKPLNAKGEIFDKEGTSLGLFDYTLTKDLTLIDNLKKNEKPN